MWRLLVKIAPSLTGGSYDGNITALAGELVAMDADVSSEHIFFVYKENFLESFTALKSCDEFHDLPNKASTLAGAAGRQSSTGFTVPPGSGQTLNDKDKEGFCVDGSFGFCCLPLLSFAFWSFSSHGVSKLCLQRRSAPLKKGVFFILREWPSRPRVVYGVRRNDSPGPVWSTAFGTCSRPIFSFTVVVRVLTLPLVFRQLSSLRNRVPLGHCKCSFDENRVDVEDCILHKMGCLSTTEVTFEAVDTYPCDEETTYCGFLGGNTSFSVNCPNAVYFRNTARDAFASSNLPFGQGPAKLVGTDCAITESRGLHHQ